MPGVKKVSWLIEAGTQIDTKSPITSFADNININMSHKKGIQANVLYNAAFMLKLTS